MALTPTGVALLPNQIDTSTLLDVPAPVAPGTLLGGTPNFQTAGSSIGYIPTIQPGSPYSATNLPEFMKGYEQTPSGRFVMSQGLLGMPPQIDQIQSLFSQGYAQEYTPLEQKFQESFAFDPSMFGNIYRAGGFIPASTGMEVGEISKPMDPALALAGAAGLAKLYPYAEDLFKTVTEPVAPEAKQAEEAGGNWFEENITRPAQQTFIDPIVKTWQKSQVKKDIDNYIAEVDKKYDKPEWLNNMQESAKKLLSDVKSNPVVGGTSQAVDAIGNLQKLINNPSVNNVYDAVESVNKVNQFLPEGTNFQIPPDMAGAAVDLGAGLSITKAFEDPTAANVANAYAGANHLAINYADTALPGGGSIGSVGNILSGIEALEGGIENVGEATALLSGAASAAQMAGIGAGTATGTALAGASAALGPIAAGIALEDILAEDMSVKDILQSLPVLGRAFGGGGNVFGYADVKRSDGEYVIGQESSKKKGFEYTLPEANAAGLILKELENTYGYTFNEDAWADVDKRVDFENGTYHRGAQDIVVDALQKGALVPSADSPTTIDWADLFTTARDRVSAGEQEGLSGEGTKVYSYTAPKREAATFFSPALGREVTFGEAMANLGSITANAQPQTTAPVTTPTPANPLAGLNLSGLNLLGLGEVTL